MHDPDDLRDLADLRDRIALRELVDRYAIAIDRRDHAALVALFVGGGGIDVHVTGREEPVASLRGDEGLRRLVDGVGVYEDTFHLVGNFAPVVDGDTAAAVTYCVAHHLNRTAEGAEDERLYVVYDDAFVRTPGGWRFTVRRVGRRWTETQPAGLRPLAIDRAMARGPASEPSS